MFEDTKFPTSVYRKVFGPLQASTDGAEICLLGTFRGFTGFATGPGHSGAAKVGLRRGREAGRLSESLLWSHGGKRVEEKH